MRALWIGTGERAVVAELEEALATFGGVSAASLLPPSPRGFRPLLVEPEAAASDDLALHLAALLEVDVLRVALRRNGGVEIGRRAPSGDAFALPLLGGGAEEEALRALLPDVEEPALARLLGPFLLGEERIEALAGALGLDVAFATLSARAVRELVAEGGLSGSPVPGLVVERVTVPEVSPPAVAGAVAGSGPFAAMLARPRRVSVLAVVDDDSSVRALGRGASSLAAELSSSAPAGFSVRVFPPLARHGGGAVAHLAATSSLLGLRPARANARRAEAEKLLEDWAARVPLAQGLVASADWDPTLQIDQTPWEAAWDAVPLADRAPGWPRREVRGLGAMLLLDGDLRRQIGPQAPTGWSEEELRGGPSTGAVVLRAVGPAEPDAGWLLPVVTPARSSRSTEALPL